MASKGLTFNTALHDVLAYTEVVEEEVVHHCHSLVGVMAGPHCKEGGKAGPV